MPHLYIRVCVHICSIYTLCILICIQYVNIYLCTPASFMYTYVYVYIYVIFIPDVYPIRTSKHIFNIYTLFIPICIHYLNIPLCTHATFMYTYMCTYMYILH